MNIETQIKAKEALEFLREHPALNNDGGDSLFNGAWFHMELCCKNGQSKFAGEDGVSIWKSDPNWEKYKEYFDEDQNDDLPDELHEAKVPYAVVYGEPWVADHMEYWYETCFFVFNGDPYDKKDRYDYRKWERYGGPEGGANSFEEMLIAAADEVKSALGAFNSYDSFITEAEVKNHSDVEFIFFEPVSDKPGYKTITVNDKYVDISQGLKNLRWLKWFIATDYFKENWNSKLSGWQVLVDKIEGLEPDDRKRILAASGDWTINLNSRR
jgi:hypothetical protein